LLDHLESLAMASGCRTSRLETGIAQPEALALYRRAGYMDIGPFADYRPDPQSRFMGKPLRSVEAVLGRAGSFP
jgi:putative acetyltransferase